MNSETVIPNLATPLLDSPLSGPETPAPDAPPSPLGAPPPELYRRKGKVAQLPKDLRDLVNNLILDGQTYSVIIEQLSAHGISLNHENLSNWRKGGHQDYLAELSRFDYHHAKYEAASDLLQDTETSKLPEATLQTVAAQMYDLFGHFRSEILAQKLASDPDKYIRLVNALSRLTREVVHLNRQRHTTAKTEQPNNSSLDSSGKITETAREMILDTTDDILGAKAYRRPSTASGKVER